MNNINTKSIILTPLLVAACLILFGCAGTVARSVSQHNADTKGSYDGVWAAKVNGTTTPQYFGDWIFQCNDLDFTFKMNIADGKVTVAYRDLVKTTYINAKGKFRLNMPQKIFATASDASDGQFNNGKMTLVLQGDLGRSEPMGKFVVGIAEFANRGCTTDVKYQRA